MGKNCATVYFRHKDTDTEGVDGKSAEESSEEEWTYEGSQVQQQQPEQLQPEIIPQPEPEKKLQEPGLQPERPDHEVCFSVIMRNRFYLRFCLLNSLQTKLGNVIVFIIQ